MKTKTVYECEICGKQFNGMSECAWHEKDCTKAKFFDRYFIPVSVFEIEEADFIYLPTAQDYNKICKMYPFLNLGKSYVSFPLVLLRVGNTCLWRDFDEFRTEIEKRIK